MILWLASYPKSGNTWIRYFLGNYFFNKENKFDPDIIKNIRKFHLDKEIIEKVSSKEDFKKNPYNVSKYWIESQKLLIYNKNLTKNYNIFKTHSANLKVGNNNFTNSKLTLGNIYIVRDPREIVISYSKYTGKTIDETIDLLAKVNLKVININRNSDYWLNTL